MRRREKVPVTATRRPSLEEGGISPVAQNYLLTLYTMREETGSATLSRLAEELATSPASEHLGTSLASVAGMIRRMKRDGLVDILPTKEIVFTGMGKRHAEAMMRRHQLAERLLADILGLELHKVHPEAHRLEHAISAEVEEKLVQRLGNPKRCPFGHTIPGSGYVPPANAVPLDRAAANQPFLVERIPEDDPRLVEYLVKAGMVPDATVTVTEVAAYRGTMTLEIDGKDVVIGLKIAPRILVRPPGGEPAPQAAPPPATGKP